MTATWAFNEVINSGWNSYCDITKYDYNKLVIIMLGAILLIIDIKERLKKK